MKYSKAQIAAIAFDEWTFATDLQAEADYYMAARMRVDEIQITGGNSQIPKEIRERVCAEIMRIAREETAR